MWLESDCSGIETVCESQENDKIGKSGIQNSMHEKLVYERNMPKSHLKLHGNHFCHEMTINH